MDTYAGYNYDTSYYDVTTATGGIIGLILGMIGFILLISAIIYIIGVIGQWKVLKKAGQDGWPALIPIYNVYMLCKISGVNAWWILILFISALLSSIPVIGALLFLVVSIYFSLLLYVSLAHSFGKDTGWVIGLWVLNPFFMLAMGVGKSQYIGPKPMKDIIFGNLGAKNDQATNYSNANQSMNNNFDTSTMNSNFDTSTINSTTNSNPIGGGVETLNSNLENKYCPGCGIKLTNDVKFCPRCGRQL